MWVIEFILFSFECGEDRSKYHRLHRICSFIETSKIPLLGITIDLSKVIL